MSVRDALSRTAVNVYNWTAGWACGRPSCYAASSEVSNVYEVADAILEAQAHSLFVKGFVNGDPHPGNIMLLQSGKIGLIDWGQARAYDAAERCALPN
eukprot:TRINITY_DN73796_c0_g1_i1.p1 TRINITY_DN73796_c0_g1~~TRINITY_DN73796_c0_g1_i1.p1  ORF type:complete len:109 (-),score=7.57 TRINITY_DN73796_c0_g1_i1:155-448(-)